MGVPQFFHWLVTHYKKELLHQNYRGGSSTGGGQSKDDSQQNEDPTQPEYLYLDFNCGIHPAVKQPHLKDLESMYQAVIDYLRLIVRQVKPTTLVYIAIDGVAPNAKMKQQRSRRFKAIQDKRERDVIDRKHQCWEKSEIDYNMISPGTAFMEELSRRLQAYLAEGWTSDFPELAVTLDDAGNPGEGEHKIMYHLRTQVDTRSRVVIYGLDSDLIFLCLLNYRPGLCLFREKIIFGQEPVDKTKKKTNGSKETKNEDQNKQKPSPMTPDQVKKGNDEVKSNQEPKKALKGAEGFTYLHVGELRKIILSILDPSLTNEELLNWGIMQPALQRRARDLDLKGSLDSIPTEDELAKARADGVEELKKRYLALNLGETVAQKLIRDYVASTFILGNDFLPHLPSLKIKEGGLNRVMECYKEIQEEMPNSYLVREDGQTFNYIFFRKFLERLAVWEHADFMTHREASEVRQSKFKTSFSYRTASPYLRDLKDWEYVEDKYTDSVRLGDDGWKERYYQHYFSDNSDELVRSVIVNYLEGMIWMLRYYGGNGVMEPDQMVKTCASWDWSYHYRNAPALSCLVSHLQPDDLEVIQFEIGAPVATWEQLLVILPPQSQALLPPALGRLMTGVDSPLIHLYPIDFQIDLVGHRFRWECYPILPAIDLNLIRKTLRTMGDIKKLKERYKVNKKDET